MEEERVVIVDGDDNHIGNVKRSEMRKKVLPHRGTGVLTFNSKGEILIHKRTITKDNFPGYYDLMHGGAVIKDESYDDNARRETEEEMGIKNPRLTRLFKHKYFKEDNRVFINVYKIEDYDGPLRFQKEEVESGRFVTLNELKKMIKKEKFCPNGLEVFKEYMKNYHKPKNTKAK